MKNIKKKIFYYWKNKNFINIEKTINKIGAATFHEKNIKFVLNKKNFKICFNQNCFRQFDSYLNNKNKLCIHNQIQIICKPIPFNFLNLYKNSLYFIKNIFFKKDNWNSPILGAKGIGFEAIKNKIEISQLTIFYFFGNKKIKPILEITYGIERIYNILKCEKKIFFKEKKNSIFNNFNFFSFKKIIKFFLNCFNSFVKNNFYISYTFFLKLSNYFNIIDSFYLSNNFNRVKIILLLKKILEKILEKIFNF